MVEFWSLEPQDKNLNKTAKQGTRLVHPSDEKMLFYSSKIVSGVSHYQKQPKGGVSMKSCRTIPGLITALAIVLTLTSAAQATALLYMPLAEQVNRANIIVVGNAGSSLCELETMANEISTYRVVTVDQVIKGDASLREVVVKTPGGKVGALEVQVLEAPDLVQGHEYVILLYENSQDYKCNIVGWQGWYEIEDGIVKANGKSVEEFIREIQVITNQDEK